MPSASAFPLWINEIPAISELQRLHRSREGTHQHSPASCSSSLLTICDLFRCNTHDPKECWRYVLLSSYMTDFEWLLTTVPELSAVTEKVVILSGVKGTATVRRVEKSRYLPTSAAEDRVNPFLTALRVVGQRPRFSSVGAAACCSPFSRARLAVLEPPLPIAFGTHHTKMALCVNARGVRVCIFTANLLEQDWCWKTQGIYVQDFPWAEPSLLQQQKSAKALDFEQQLRHYWLHCGVDITSSFSWEAARALPLGIFNTDFLSHVNFSAAKVWLISAVPGTHAGGEAIPGYRVGLCRLAEVLQNPLCSMVQAIATETTPQQPLPVVLTWQFSSQGSLNPNFLHSLEAAMCGAPELCIPSTSAVVKDTTKRSNVCTPLATVQEVQIIYPTETEVRNSFEGWRGGGSLPVRLQCCHEYVNERLCRWGCRQRLTLPQNEQRDKKDSVRAGSLEDDLAVDTYDSLELAVDANKREVQDSAKQGEPFKFCAAACRQYAMPHIKSYAAMNPARTHLHWYLLTSANLSQAAWGSLSVQATKKAPWRLLVRSYELGVLYDRTSAVDVTGSSSSGAAAESWFSVVASPSIHLPTSANSRDALFATPLGEDKSYHNSNRSNGSSGSSDVNTGRNDADDNVGPLLFLPCDMLRPDPYASTIALRARRQGASSSSVPPSAIAAVSALSRRDVPWVIDIPHSGPDAYGRYVEEAFAAGALPPLSRWRPFPEKGTCGGTESAVAAGRKRARK